MQPVQYEQLVALPFNAAASRTRQHKDCPTFGMTRRDLWKSTYSMMLECWEEYGNFGNLTSHQFRLSDRFHYNEWKPERIKSERDKFLAHESSENFTSLRGPSARHGFIVLDTQQQKVVGEIHLLHTKNVPTVASPYDMITASERGKGLAINFAKLLSRTAEAIGYTALDIGIEKRHAASNNRLQQAVKLGLAEIRPPSATGYRYWIDVKKLNAYFSGHCG